MTSTGLTRSAFRNRTTDAVRMCVMSTVLTAGLAGMGCRHLDFGSGERTLTDWNNPAVGRMAMRMYLRSHQASQQPEQRLLLDQVGSRLAAAANRPGYDWHFELVDDPQPRVVVFPGGNVAVTEGMIAACDNEAEFAAALAHELGHMLAGHEMPAPMPDSFQAPDRVRHDESTNPQARHDPQDELEADSIAMSLLARAGYEPQALISFWLYPDANRERAAFTAAHGEHRGHMPQLQESLVQAQQIYRANPQKQGLGIQIVRTEVSSGQGPTIAGDLRSERTRNRWTASNDHRNGPRKPDADLPYDPRGATKPSGWNADLLDSGQWLLPVEGDVQQAGYEWTSTGEGR
jgi:metalloendopeptidase OMA1, mitochondrial